MVNILRATQKFILSERFTDEGIFQKIIRSDGFAKKLEERIDGAIARKRVGSETLRVLRRSAVARRKLKVSERDRTSLLLIKW